MLEKTADASCTAARWISSVLVDLVGKLSVPESVKDIQRPKKQCTAAEKCRTEKVKWTGFTSNTIQNASTSLVATVHNATAPNFLFF